MAAGPSEYGRRTWNLKDYEKHSSDEEDDQGGKKDKKSTEPAAKPTAPLKPREAPVDLESKLGKSVVISKATPTSQAGGFFCEVCDCVVKDSINYLDHINGKKHQRNIGFNVKKVQKSNLSDVEARFEAAVKKKEEKKSEYDVQERVKELKEEEERLKEYRKEKKKNKKRKRDEEEGEVDEADMAALMGFSSFSSGKKK